MIDNPDELFRQLSDHTPSYPLLDGPLAPERIAWSSTAAQLYFTHKAFPQRAAAMVYDNVRDLAIDAISALNPVDLKNAGESSSRLPSPHPSYHGLFMASLVALLPPDVHVIPEKAMGDGMSLQYRIIIATLCVLRSVSFTLFPQHMCTPASTHTRACKPASSLPHHLLFQCMI